MTPEPPPSGTSDALWSGVCAVVPAGGAGRRLGGVDKPAVLVGGRSLLDHVLGGLPPGVPVAVVGPDRRVAPVGVGVGVGRAVVACREDPPGGGPAAAVAAGLTALERYGLLGRVVVVVPADAPRATDALPRLLEALRRGGPLATAAVAVDAGPGGRRQVLVAAHDVAALQQRVAALGGALAGLPAARLLPDGAGLVEVPAPVNVLADVDTPADLAAARAAHGATRRAGDDPPA